MTTAHCSAQSSSQMTDQLDQQTGTLSAQKSIVLAVTDSPSTAMAMLLSASPGSMAAAMTAGCVRNFDRGSDCRCLSGELPSQQHELASSRNESNGEGFREGRL